ncbi:hypothetical protein PG994_002412 [Apiospora phragmitis]|uniref:Uncharacterized protein n=1 Tax=Apiospora phragmitis TaxID=2905665 RepID=A0ABR1WWA7_9PEZI
MHFWLVWIGKATSTGAGLRSRCAITSNLPPVATRALYGFVLGIAFGLGLGIVFDFCLVLLIQTCFELPFLLLLGEPVSQRPQKLIFGCFHGLPPSLYLGPWVKAAEPLAILVSRSSSLHDLNSGRSLLSVGLVSSEVDMVFTKLSLVRDRVLDEIQQRLLASALQHPSEYDGYLVQFHQALDRLEDAQWCLVHKGLGVVPGRTSLRGWLERAHRLRCAQ